MDVATQILNLMIKLRLVTLLYQVSGGMLRLINIVNAGETGQNMRSYTNYVRLPEKKRRPLIGEVLESIWRL